MVFIMFGQFIWMNCLQLLACCITINIWIISHSWKCFLLFTEGATKDDDRIKRAVSVCKKVVSAFSYSWKKRRHLAIAQNEMGLPKHALTTETPTRWGSRQKMIERILEQEKAIAEVLRADRKSRHLVLTWQDVEVLESLNKVLSPLQDFTDALSGEEYVSVSYLKPVLHLFNTSILAVEENDTQLTKDIKKKILAYLNEKYADPDTDDLLDMASLLDPRFRTTYISYEKVEDIQAKAVEEIKSIQAESEMTGSSTTDMSVPAGSVSPPEEKRKKSLSSFFKMQSKSSMGSSSCDTLSEDSIKMELRSYLQTQEVDSNTDPLTWWKSREVNFPRIAKLARQYLCIPATSTPSERVFSTGGNIVTCHRAALKPDAVDRLIFLARNL